MQNRHDYSAQCNISICCEGRESVTSRYRVRGANTHKHHKSNKKKNTTRCRSGRRCERDTRRTAIRLYWKCCFVLRRVCAARGNLGARKRDQTRKCKRRILVYSTSGSSGEENDKINRSHAYLLEKILRLFSLLAFLALNQSGNQFPCQSVCRTLWKNREKKKTKKKICHPKRLKLTKRNFYRKIALCAVSSNSFLIETLLFFPSSALCLCVFSLFYRWNVSGRIERCKLQTENKLKQLCNNK